MIEKTCATCGRAPHKDKTPLLETAAAFACRDCGSVDAVAFIREFCRVVDEELDAAKRENEERRRAMWQLAADLAGAANR